MLCRTSGLQELVDGVNGTYIVVMLQASVPCGAPLGGIGSDEMGSSWSMVIYRKAF
jgi:hypothetical protein